MRDNIKTILTFVGLTVGMVLMICVMLYQLFMITYDPELHKRTEIAEQNAKQRVKAMEQIRLEAMCKDERFDHSDC
ncbi:hypothetical protein [Bacillus cihuensis]|uniref:hypothetical protein n=1 Tax=Bacillus cihuensis TaxID=1208599 RepID=UPI00048CBA1C|nr:hypothetical protein [Bacillus cihuensis]